MDYKQARAYIEEINGYGCVLGLANVKELLQRMKLPKKGLAVIHVAGTNGKGSVVSYLSTIYQEMGYKVCRYISPTICKYRERIQINNRYIEKADFAEGITILKELADQMVKEGLPHPTPFEVETALCLWYAKKTGCHLLILECGLGGAEDATNAIEGKIATVFASISWDHMGFLGESLEEIAKAKAGIMRKRVPVISVKQEPEAEKVLRQEAQKNQAEFILADAAKVQVKESNLEHQIFSYEGYKDLEISLVGRHQIDNAVLALRVVDKLQARFPVSKQALRQGFLSTRWVGRCTTIRREPRIIMDGAHNEDAAKKLARFIREQLAGKRLIYLMGVFKDKEYERIAAVTASYAEQIITFTIPDNDRALSGIELAYTIQKYNAKVTSADSLKEALEMALLLAGKEDVILAFGSLSFQGRLMELLEEMKKNK
ncbi:MAG: bifunctional folylpolyglutamate synthase/dihydrofolate synthase [Lachnospiraceae bacterium]|nr:bifunctional folylpolyglutamate synthase/dihydrofolate synthase [Lachnospiraceae bacterium]